jgi:hypothetical protein
MAEVPPSVDRPGDDVHEGAGGSGPSSKLTPAQVGAEIEELRGVGSPNRQDEWIRTVRGNDETARALFDRYVDGNHPVEWVGGIHGGWRGRIAGDQGWITFRPASKSGSPALSISGLDGFPKGGLKIHFDGSP